MPIEVGETSLTMGSKRPNARRQELYEEADASDPGSRLHARPQSRVSSELLMSVRPASTANMVIAR
jgi:hypothetical protein